MEVTNLRCEYMVDPIGLGNRTPRIMWNDDNITKQTAFDLEYTINGSKQTIHRDTDEMYFDFLRPLNSRDIVEWRVRIYDENGDMSEYSETARFEMGLLEIDDFKAKWISGDYKAEKRKRYPVDCFRKVFAVDRPVAKARVYASACGLYELCLNGNRVGDFVFAPGSTDCNKRIQYQTYDITDLLKEGKNTLTALLADGWYRGSIGAKGRTNTYGAESKLFVQMEILETGGNVQYVLSDKSFSWSNDGPIRFADLKDGEVVDNTLLSCYSGKARECDFRANLTASDNFAVKEMEYFHPTKRMISSTGKQIFELPFNIAGYISFAVDGHMGQKVEVVMGEMLDENGDISLKNIQTVTNGKPSPLQTVRFFCKEGRNEYKSKFYFGGFRYLSVDSEIEFNCQDIQGITLYSCFEETSKFKCSNELINVFYENTLRSLKGNSIDIPTDCPTRERMGWTGDSQIFFNTASYLTNYAPFARKHVRDLFDRQWKDGKLAQIVPYSNEDWFMDPMNGSVGWADAGVLIPYRYYEKYGDDRLLKENFEGIKKYGEFMISRLGKWGGLYAQPIKVSKENKKYIASKGQSYGEWAEPKDVRAFVWYDFAQPHPEESTAYTSWILGMISDICTMLGDPKNAKRYKKISENVKKAYQELVTTEGFKLDTDRQAKLVRPLYMDLLEEEQTQYAKERLIQALENYGWRLGTGFLSTPFILDVLCDIDKEAAYRLLENEEMPGWLYMAKNSTGTIWEGWEGLNADSGIASLNHYSKGAMVEWLISRMCGIRVEGKNHFHIEPVIGGKETNACAEYDSVYGKICAGWILEKNKVFLTLDIPGNTTATVKFGELEENVGMGHHEYAVEI
ncbi:MAG: family 78 glycoside hydrolase catalytic domain [Oscillospiraceae bacterium]|nr:family 78 glycoside hydrolase catalytic domain [Oscillospiraceae bacterium]